MLGIFSRIRVKNLGSVLQLLRRNPGGGKKQLILIDLALSTGSACGLNLGISRSLALSGVLGTLQAGQSG
jgi:hypothetical protein